MADNKYIVMVDDNFHFTDVTERYSLGEFKSYSDAVMKCKSIVDDYLEAAYEPNMSPQALYNSYMMYGEDPFIKGETDEHFSAWKYAEIKSKEMAG